MGHLCALQLLAWDHWFSCWVKTFMGGMGHFCALRLMVREHWFSSWVKFLQVKWVIFALCGWWPRSIDFQAGWKNYRWNGSFWALGLLAWEHRFSSWVKWVIFRFGAGGPGALISHWVKNLQVEWVNFAPCGWWPGSIDFYPGWNGSFFALQMEAREHWIRAGWKFYGWNGSFLHFAAGGPGALIFMLVEKITGEMGYFGLVAREHWFPEHTNYDLEFIFPK